MKLTLASLITCPRCGHSKEEIMPGNASLYFYKCEGCQTVLRPREGECCVFCSYGTEKCAPAQMNDWYLSMERESVRY